MTLAIDITDGCGLSDEAHHELLQGNVVFAIYYMVKGVIQLYTTNKTERFSFKSGCAMQVAKLIKQDWLIL